MVTSMEIANARLKLGLPDDQAVFNAFIETEKGKAYLNESVLIFGAFD